MVACENDEPGEGEGGGNEDAGTVGITLDAEDMTFAATGAGADVGGAGVLVVGMDAVVRGVNWSRTSAFCICRLVFDNLKHASD